MDGPRGDLAHGPLNEEAATMAYQAAVLARVKQLDLMRQAVYPDVRLRVERKAAASKDQQDGRMKILSAPLTVGQAVYTWLQEQMPKDGERWNGPFYVVAVSPAGNYKLRTQQGDLLAREFPARLLKLGKELDQEKAVHAVEKVVRHRTTEDGREFLVRWEGFGRKSDSWVTEIDFADDGRSVREYFEARNAKHDESDEDEGNETDEGAQGQRQKAAATKTRRA